MKPTCKGDQTSEDNQECGGGVDEDDPAQYLFQHRILFGSWYIYLKDHLYLKLELGIKYCIEILATLAATDIDICTLYIADKEANTEK